MKLTRPTCFTFTRAARTGDPPARPAWWRQPDRSSHRLHAGWNVSAYIPTNLISITDGQIYLSTRLFNEGQRPAIDVGLSVSRVGGAAQPPVLRQVVGDLKLLYSQLPELESFTRFGSELEPQTRQRLIRGRRLREVFKQRPHCPLRLGIWSRAVRGARWTARLAASGTGRPIPGSPNSPLENIERDLLENLERSPSLSNETQLQFRTAIAAETSQLIPTSGVKS